METETISSRSVDQPFYASLASAAMNRQFVRLEYLTDLHEFIKADVSLKRLFAQEGKDWLELGNGDHLPIERVVSISGQLSPNFPGYANYSCDC